MHVLAMVHLYPPAHNAGAEMMAHSMFRALVRRGHKVTVQLSQAHKAIPAAFELDGVQVHPYRGKKDPFRWLSDADVIVTYLENTPRATVLGRASHKPIVHIEHNTLEPSKKWLQPDIALGVYNSRWMQNDFETWMKKQRRQSPPSIVVHPPVDPKEYATTPGNKVTLINLYEPKGAKTFYALAERMPDVKFLGVRGAYGEQLIRDLPNVEIAEHTPNARDDIYARTRVLLVPSDYESWGRVGVEAMCSGIPVIAHPTPGLRESLGSAGTFCDRDDMAAWERELRRLLDGRKWKAASRRALTRAAELDPTDDLARWCDVMEMVVARGSRITAGR